MVIGSELATKMVWLPAVGAAGGLEIATLKRSACRHSSRQGA